MQVGMVMRWVLELQLFPHFKLEQSQVDNFMLELAKTIILTPSSLHMPAFWHPSFLH